MLPSKGGYTCTFLLKQLLSVGIVVPKQLIAVVISAIG
jgi:hypothetical protein